MKRCVFGQQLTSDDSVIFAQHPFRRYQFGVWREEEVCGVWWCIGHCDGVAVALLATWSGDGELLRRWATAVTKKW
ncbi:MAG: hypothetical protein R3E31_06075 [Chloroflexota bacterium]